MPDVRIGLLARRQLVAVVEQRRDQSGVLAAERLRAAFDRFTTTVSQFPRVGALFHRAGDYEFRRFPVAGFTVHFRVGPTGHVVVADIRGGSMRPPQLDALERQAEQTAEGRPENRG